MRTYVEIVHRGETLEQRDYPGAVPVPEVGERVMLFFENPNTTEELGAEWIVLGRRFLLGGPGDPVMVQLECQPYRRGLSR